MMLEVIQNYQSLLSQISHLIDISGYRHDHLAKKIGLKSTTFSSKKQKGSWSPEELAKLISIIENEDTEDYFLGVIMKHSENDERMTLAEFKKEAGWK